MKNKKNIIGLVIVLVCLVLSVILILTRCSNAAAGQQEQPSTSGVEDTADTTGGTTDGPTVDETTEETTEETEESTEESTEETEEETTSGGSSTPGGTGGFVGATTPTEGTEEETTAPTEEKIDVEEPGTQNIANTEYLSTLPDTIGSVKIPANGTISYNLYQTEESVLTIEDADAYLILGGVTYTPDKDGVLTVDLPACEGNAPIAFQLGSKASAEKAYSLMFAAPLGKASNPEELTFIEQITATITSKYTDGYYYTWVAAEDGTLTLSVAQITPEDAQCDIILTLGDTVTRLSDSQDGTVSIVMEAEEEVTIQVVVTPAGTEAEVAITGSFAPGFGTKSNPYVVMDVQVPGSFDTVEIPADKEKYYDVYYVGGTVLTIEDPDAYVIYNGETYTADESGVLTLTLKNGDPRTPVSLIIGNAGEEAESYTVSFTPALGSVNNPLIVEDVTEIIAAIPEGSDSGYYIQWTAPNDGILSIEASVVPETVEFDVILTNMNGYAMAWLSDGSPATMDVVKDDVVMIQVAISPDENWTYPAAEVTLTGTYTQIYGTANSPYTAALEELPGSIETVEIEAGTAVYYEISNVSGSILTIEDPDVYVIYNGVTYTPDESGVLTLEVKASSSRHPVTFQIGNQGEAGESYILNFTPTTGSMGNPEVVYSLFTLDTTLESGNTGYYYSYTATADGAVSFWVDEENSSDVAYDIILTSTGSYTTEMLSESAHGTVSMLVTEGDVVTIQVTTVSTSGSNPAGYLAVKGAVFTGDGTADRPYMTTVINVPGGLATVDITNGSEISYSIYRIGDTILTIEGEDAYVIYDGVTYNAVDGVVTVNIAAVRPGYTTNLIVGNYLTAQEQEDELEEESEAYLMKVTTVLGTYGNPEILTDITSFKAKLKAGNETGYYFKWTAPTAGTVSFQIASITTGVEGSLSITQSNSASQTVLEGDEIATIDVEAGEVVQIIVAVLPDESYNYPAATIVVNAGYVTEEEETTEAEAAAQDTEKVLETTEAESVPETEAAPVDQAAENQPAETETVSEEVPEAEPSQEAASEPEPEQDTATEAEPEQEAATEPEPETEEISETDPSEEA